MSSHDVHETPLELREIEARLRLLRPEKSPDLVRSVELFIATMNERESLPVPSASFCQFTRFVRRAQYRAGAFGMLVGMLFGAVLGGLCVYWAMNGPDFRHQSYGMLRQIGRVTPTQTLFMETRNDLPVSVNRVLRYYEGVAKMCENAG